MLRALAVTVALAAPASAEDLAAVYPVDLPEGDGTVYATDWEVGPEDVWKLSLFQYEVPDKVKIRLGRSQVAIGHDGTNAVWALVVPDRPAKLSTSLGGDGEKIEHIWMRFHPSRIGELFPEKTVRDGGDPDLLYWAFRVYGAKIGGEYGTGNVGVIPPEDALVLDIDTSEGTRRVFDIDLDSGRVRYKSGYITKACPELVEVKKRDAVSLVEAVWDEFDSSYALFHNSPEVDWDLELEEAKRACARAKSSFEAGIVVRKMLDRLEDDDLWVLVGDELVTRDQYTRQFNASWTGLNHILGNVTRTDHGLAWARTPHNVGYVNLLRFGSDEVVEELDETLETLGSTWALIVDLRYTRYGEREIAEEIAGRFLADETVYGYVQRRSGAGRTEFGEAEELSVSPRGEWRYEAPLYLVLGPGTAREGEQLALMLKRAPKVVTTGSPTLGLNSSTERIEFDAGLAVVMAVGRDLDADGNPIHAKGLEPDLPITAEEEEFTSENDPVLYSVLEEVLKTPHADRKLGNRNKPGAEEGGAGEEEVSEG